MQAGATETDAVRKRLSKVDKSIGPSGAPRRRYRTIWISDVHLGTRGCNDRLLIDFLDHVDSDTLYLVGDIIDGWRLEEAFLLARAAQRDRPPGDEAGQARHTRRLHPRQS